MNHINYLKQLVFIFFFIGFIHNTRAQVIGNISNNQTLGYNLILIPEKEPQKLEGSPYLTENFVRGKVLIPGKPNLDTFLRYNVSGEHFEIKTHLSSPKIYRLAHSSRATYEIYPDLYSWRQLETGEKKYSGYFIVHYEGKGYNLLEKKVARFISGRSASTSYERDIPPAVNIHSKFFVVSSLGEVQEVNFNRRKLKKIFPSKEIKTFLKHHKIKEKEDLIEFVKFLDQG